jgi:DNA-binding GntR family transcriptional regulator
MRNELVYARLRADILGGQLRPGQRLPFATLCVQYGTSVGVLREALARLTEQGLVLNEPQHGFRIASVSAADLMDLTTARCEVESAVARSAVTSGDLAWESQLVAAHHVLAGTPQRLPGDPKQFNDAWAQAHRDFHTTLLDGCPSPRLRSIAASLRDAAELYWQPSLRPIGHETRRDVGSEHQHILDAVVARDHDQVVNLLQAHIRRTTEVLLNNNEALVAVTPPDQPPTDTHDQHTEADHTARPPRKRRTPK